MGSKSDFFYSKSTGLYISRGPLKIDARVVRAAEKAGIKLNWDDEGTINFIDLDDSKKLLKELGAEMIDPKQYWRVMGDAKREKDEDMIHSLTSNRFTEWLDRVYLRDNNYIDHPKIISKYNYSGKKEKSKNPLGRPGWFNPENNLQENGEPKKVELNREKFATSWKYWSPDHSVTALSAVAPIRGYVTSVGKPSWDLGIPVDARQPLMMIRECRKKPLDPPLDPKLLREAEEIMGDYETYNRLKNRDSFEKMYSRAERYLSFVSKNGKSFRKSKELSIYKIRERLFDLMGVLRGISLSKKDGKDHSLESASKALSGYSQNASYEDFLRFIKSSKSRLKSALREKKDVIFVMGHKNPDTDTAVSCLFEAWRNSLIDEKTDYIPIIQSNKIPDEARKLLGDEIADSIPLHSIKEYGAAKKSGLARWISVDQNREPEVQKYFVSIVDHHFVSEMAKNRDLPKTLELTGSCTALITGKMLGMGMNLDDRLSKILYGATLMDTENRVKHKMTVKDEYLMDYLKNRSKTESDHEFYQDLMSHLLNTDDADILFGRDYKEDWGFGFAVTKIKGGFDKRGDVLKKSLINRSLDLAKKNNVSKNLPLTVLRVTDYEDDNETVNRERVYMIFNKASREFKRNLVNLMESIIKFEFRGTKIKKTADYIDFWGTGLQLSRKKTAPVLEPVVRAFNEYFYSPSTALWVKRDFLKKTHDSLSAAKRSEIKLSTDESNRINYITYSEVGDLLKSLDYSMLSLREYWNVLNDANKIKDVQMIESLQGSNFVEFLDTVIKDYRWAIEHPIIKGKKINGKRMRVNVPKGKPGLIHPNEVDLKTGIPKSVRKPNEYGNPELWRYWEPDSDIVIPVRSYIFLMKQPCWDGKMHLNDSFPNMGIRPCCKKVKSPGVSIRNGKEKMIVQIKKDGDIINYIWRK